MNSMKKTIGLIALFVIMLIVSVASAFAATLTIDPSNPDTTNSLTCDVAGTNQVFTYRWFRNGNYGNQIWTNTNVESTMPSSQTQNGDLIHCLAYVPADQWNPEIYVGQITVEIQDEDEEDLPECSDGIDNADPEDNIADWPNDPGCDNPQDDDETDEMQPNNAPNIGIPNQVEDEFDSFTVYNTYINLWTYANDAEDTDAQLDFELVSESNTQVVNCWVSNNHYLACAFPAYQVGQSTLQVRVTDTDGAQDTDSFTITVNDVNQPPVLAGIPDQFIEEASGLNANLVDLFQFAYDPDNTDIELTFTLQSESNPGLVDCYVNNDRYVSCVTNAGIGSSTVVVRVSDGQSIDTDTFIVNVVENAPPVLNNIPDIFVDEDSGLNQNVLNLWTYTQDGDTPLNQLSYQIIGETNPSLVTCDVSNGHFVDCTTIMVHGNGQSFVTVEVDDGVSTDTDVFRVTVLPVNDCPAIDPINDVYVTAGDNVVVNPDGYDADSDPLQSSCTDPLGANCAWQTQPGDEGIYPITATVTDGICDDSTNFNVIVESPVTECNDGINNDGDPWTDWPNDPGCESALDDSEDPNPACSDGLDNDGDLFIDWPDDPGCVDIYDDDEYNYLPECSDGIDNDMDGWVDYPADPGCTSALDDAESPNPACSDGIDNDGDLWIDYPDDPGCSSIHDNDEFNFIPACSDGIDNDLDGWVDFPNDPGCSDPNDNQESPNPACSDGIDNDLDGFTDFPNDPGCDDIFDNDEFDAPPVYECSDGIDNDLDGLVDFPNDPGCLNAMDDSEWNPPVDPECSDGMDNDMDGFIDWPADPGCTDPNDNSELDGPNPECSDGIDNDLDGFVDWPADLGCTDANDDSELDVPPVYECSDGIDNDLDGWVDYPNDPGCSAPTDDDESDNPECSDGIDNDMDGFIDFPNDLGCTDIFDDDETNPANIAPSCDIDPNGPLNVEIGDEVWIEATGSDVDGLIATWEWNYSGTINGGVANVQNLVHNQMYVFNQEGQFVWTFTVVDDDGATCSEDITINVEAPQLPECSDGIDNDNDGFTDYPDDFGCTDADDDDESDPPQCSDGIDNDGDGYTDMDDPACDSPDDDDESDDPQCSDGIDNDGDGDIDYPDDDGCTSIHDDLEYREAPKKPTPKINNVGEKLVISNFDLMNGDDLTSARCDVNMEDVVLGPNVMLATDGCLHETDKFHELGILLALFNDDTKKAYDVVVTFDIPDLQVRKVSNRFNINAHDVVEKKLKFEVPANTPAGLYPVRVEIVSERDSSKRRVVYRDIVISQPQITKHVHDIELNVQEPAPKAPLQQTTERSIWQLIMDAILAVMADFAALLFKW